MFDALSVVESAGKDALRGNFPLEDVDFVAFSRSYTQTANNANRSQPEKDWNQSRMCGKVVGNGSKHWKTNLK